MEKQANETKQVTYWWKQLYLCSIWNYKGGVMVGRSTNAQRITESRIV